MRRKTNQMEIWAGKFGKDYTERNDLTLEEMEQLDKKNYGYTRTELNNEFIGNLDRSIKILEVACNIGNQLICLQKMGFKFLYGIELQDYAVELSKSKSKHINIIEGSAFDIPYKDGYFNLVFTSGFLIHISPLDIENVLKEIYRCSKKYIFGLEYFANEYTEVSYRGHGDLLWKTDFAKLYLDTFDDLRLLKEKKYKYLHNDNIDSVFLLEQI